MSFRNGKERRFSHTVKMIFLKFCFRGAVFPAPSHSLHKNRWIVNLGNPTLSEVATLVQCPARQKIVGGISTPLPPHSSKKKRYFCWGCHFIPLSDTGQRICSFLVSKINSVYIYSCGVKIEKITLIYVCPLKCGGAFAKSRSFPLSQIWVFSLNPFFE